MNIIELKNISKECGGTTILDNINLVIKKNEFLTILDPGWCGKTTTLRIIGRFAEASVRALYSIVKILQNKREINTAFQKYSLYPHMNIADNISFGLKTKNEIDKKVKEILRLVSLEGFENRSMDSLIVGQQQRMAIASCK